MALQGCSDLSYSWGDSGELYFITAIQIFCSLKKVQTCQYDKEVMTIIPEPFRL